MGGSSKILIVGVWLLAIAVFLKVIVYHLEIVGHLGPLMSREAAHVVNTDRLLDQKDLYLESSLPVYTNLYGIGYNLFCIPLSLVFGVSFLSHRATSMILLLVSSYLIFGFVRRREGSRLAAFLSAALFYSIQVFSYSISSSPDFSGLCLMLLGFAVVDKFQFSYVRLFCAMILGIAALLTKPYFVFVIPCIALSLFLNKSKLTGFLFFVSSVICSLLIITVLSKQLPFISMCFELHYAQKTSSLWFFLQQWKWFLVFQFSLVFLIVYLVWGTIFSERVRYRFGLQFWPINSPLLKHKVDTFIPSTISAFSVLVVSLSWHGGAFLIYFNHLLTPGLIIIAALVCVTKRGGLVHQWSMFANLVLLHFLWPPFPRVDIGSSLYFDNLFSSEKKQILASSHFAYSLRENGKEVFDNGETEYFLLYGVRDNSNQDNRYYVLSTRHLENLKYKIENKYFDLIAVSEVNLSRSYFKAAIEHNYTIKDRRLFPLYFSAFATPMRWGKTSEPFLILEAKPDGISDELYTRGDQTK